MARIVLLHLSLIKGIGPACVERLLQKISAGQLHNLYGFSVADFMQCGLTQKQAELVVQGLADKKIVEAELALLQKHAIAWYTIIDAEYPAHLKQIYLPPTVLYVRGSLHTSFEKTLAVVGSRQANQYGQTVIAKIIPDLVAHDWTIVSGGALGIDSMAHRATLAHQGKTIAVLGSGLLKPYPHAHRTLFEQIVSSGGALVSAFNLDMEALPGNFPARNRIIAGLSRGSLIVQAARKSGALITAHFALEQSREVFAIPGPIDDPLSAGCHELIAQGATLVQASDDILHSFGYQKITQKKQVDHQPTQLNTLEDQIITLCKNPKSIDDIMQAVSLELSQIQTVLVELQLQGIVYQQSTGLWSVP